VFFSKNDGYTIVEHKKFDGTLENSRGNGAAEWKNFHLENFRAFPNLKEGKEAV
jgi:hypothetical protein